MGETCLGNTMHRIIWNMFPTFARLRSICIASRHVKRWCLAMIALTVCVPGTLLAQDTRAARFDVMEFAVEGNTVLPVQDIEAAVLPYLGPGRSAADIEAARDALEKAYQQAGYLTVLVNLPAQDVAEGVVRLEVVEQSIGRLKVSGAEYTLPSQLKAQLPEMAEGRVPQFDEVQEQLAAASRSADVTITPLLRGGAAPGSVEVELKLDDRRPLHGSIELNNKRTADTETGRLEASLRYDNLFQRRHSIGLSYFVSPSNRDDVEVFGLSYSAPLNARGLTLAAFFARSNSDVLTAFDTSAVAKGDTAGLRLVMPLPTRGASSWFHNLSVGADWKDSEQNTGLFSNLIQLNQPVRYFTLTGQYSLVSVDEGGQWRFSFGTTLSTRSMNQRTVDCNGVRLEQFACRRTDARPDFVVARAGLERLQKLPGGWSLYGRADLQRSSNPLINTEQLVAGGFDSVRGYLEAERTADEGERLRAELRTPSAAPLDDYPLQLSGLVFYDSVWLRNRSTIFGIPDVMRLSSAGLGLRTSLGKEWKLDVDVSQAFQDGAAGPGRTRDGDRRLSVRAKYEF